MNSFFNIFLGFMLLLTVSCSSNEEFDNEEAAEGMVQEVDDFLVEEGEGEELSEDQGTDEIEVSHDGAQGQGHDLYTIKKGDTLMQVAFHLYGDYRRWREIANMNPGMGTELAVGTVIKVRRPETPFVWNPDGLPHLIMRGESLGSISRDKYGTIQRWKDIWNNNRPLIRNPNLIFAGFTLYYIPDERYVAAQ